MNYFGLSNIVLHDEINVLVIEFFIWRSYSSYLCGNPMLVFLSDGSKTYCKINKSRGFVSLKKKCNKLAKGLLFIINITINNAAIIKC